ncbi:hypothetical protein SAMD00019534_004900 [Acytostelium subglobosum LB1]|uniref:hypothetical protein n=1 Tax=Acytostelium subglobosum LB1 TaxID=1410327 RepID=UPI000644B053|nr:hypothetical protein SAMD00019534_004900 [Acytostelium subglobosum LB1]GAM17315.1 hypothetical protein SAMD00019534_004900 [Acytostelium subglobosum LB1]|eukprot:XP_012759377.1 hypothetical protein SAMD00019534_004900 [Acytostelium subglobosum LB1]
MTDDEQNIDNDVHVELKGVIKVRGILSTTTTTSSSTTSGNSSINNSINSKDVAVATNDTTTASTTSNTTPTTSSTTPNGTSDGLSIKEYSYTLDMDQSILSFYEVGSKVVDTPIYFILLNDIAKYETVDDVDHSHYTLSCTLDDGTSLQLVFDTKDTRNCWIDTIGLFQQSKLLSSTTDVDNDNDHDHDDNDDKEVTKSKDDTTPSNNNPLAQSDHLGGSTSLMVREVKYSNLEERPVTNNNNTIVHPLSIPENMDHDEHHNEHDHEQGVTTQLDHSDLYPAEDMDDNPLSMYPPPSPTTTSSTNKSNNNNDHLGVSVMPVNIGLQINQNGYFVVDTPNQMNIILEMTNHGDTQCAGMLVGQFKLDWKPLSKIWCVSNESSVEIGPGTPSKEELLHRIREKINSAAANGDGMMVELLVERERVITLSSSHQYCLPGGLVLGLRNEKWELLDAPIPLTNNNMSPFHKMRQQQQQQQQHHHHHHQQQQHQQQHQQQQRSQTNSANNSPMVTSMSTSLLSMKHAVIEVVTYFDNAATTPAKDYCGDDTKCRRIAVLVRGKLSSTIANVLSHGFRVKGGGGAHLLSSLVQRNNHIWDFIESYRRMTSHSSIAGVSLCQTIEAINRQEHSSHAEYAAQWGDPNLKLRTFICLALNNHILDQWLICLRQNQSAVTTYYDKNALINCLDVWKSFSQLFIPLHTMTFKLSLDYECKIKLNGRREALASSSSSTSSTSSSSGAAVLTPDLLSSQPSHSGSMDTLKSLRLSFSTLSSSIMENTSQIFHALPRTTRQPIISINDTHHDDEDSNAKQSPSPSPGSQTITHEKIQQRIQQLREKYNSNQTSINRMKEYLNKAKSDTEQDKEVPAIRVELDNLMDQQQHLTRIISQLQQNEQQHPIDQSQNKIQTQAQRSPPQQHSEPKQQPPPPTIEAPQTTSTTTTTTTTTSQEPNKTTDKVEKVEEHNGDILDMIQSTIRPLSQRIEHYFDGY